MNRVCNPSRSHDGSLVAEPETVLERLVPASLDAPTQKSAPRNNDAAVVLRLEELVADERGHVLLSVGDSLHTVILETDAHVTSRGIVTSTDTQLGASAGEFAYLSFDVGMTVYVPADLNILLSAPKD